MSIAIKIENLSKQYRLGLVSTRTLSHDLNRWWQTSILGREDPYLKIGEENKLTSRRTPDAGRRTPDDYVWALKDINLEVEEGEVLGVIGKNGAGKSTLLKILSKVTAPTTGIVKARGRIASLLEVGTGFHQEMTGRENIYMNGAIMGMTKSEIRKKFDEIVDFAGVERYIDTPVKRYSSGMTVRLGFAVAAHLEPEILVVDEVLAVGDAEFQKKAIGKMQDVSKFDGRTVLFVSHNMGAIRTLCSQTIVLNKGRLSSFGNTEDAINSYLSTPTTKSAEYIAAKSKGIFIQYGRMLNKHNETTIIYDFGDPIKCEIFIKASDIPKAIYYSISLYNKYKNRVFTADHSLETSMIDINGELRLIYKFPDLPYAPGMYSLNLVLHLPNLVLFDMADDILPFEVVDKGSSLSKYSSFAGDMLIEGSIKYL